MKLKSAHSENHHYETSGCWIWLNRQRSLDLDCWSWKLNKHEYGPARSVELSEEFLLQLEEEIWLDE